MDPWVADRPGDLLDKGGQPDADAGRMGSPGPDQGYALKLLGVLRDDVRLVRGEHLADAEAVGVAVALKRASLFGRAPMIYDLRVAYTVWGLLDASPDPQLVAERVSRFEGVHHTVHHYPELRAIVDSVPASTLRMSVDEVVAAHRDDWRSLLTL